MIGYMKGKSAIHIALTSIGQNQNYVGMNFWAQGEVVPHFKPLSISLWLCSTASYPSLTHPLRGMGGLKQLAPPIG